jgi:hypothetical protein
VDEHPSFGRGRAIGKPLASTRRASQVASPFSCCAATSSSRFSSTPMFRPRLRDGCIKPKLTNEVLPYAFRLRGLYTDRSQGGSYEIIADWES